MTGMYGAFRADENLEKVGVVLDYGDFRITAARAGGSNKKFATVLDAKAKPLRRAIDLGVLDNEKGEQILRETYAEAVIKNWEVKRDGEWQVGIDAEDGTILPFTKANVIEAFTKLPDLFADVKEQAGKLSIFRQSIREDEAGN